MRCTILAIPLLLACVPVRAAEAPPAERPLRIGAVNIVRVFDELEEKVDMNAELRQLEEKRGVRLRELGDRVQEFEGKAKLLRPESAEAKENAKLLEDVSREFRSYRDATEDHLYNKLYDFTLGIYKKIRDEVQDCAREAGYDAVLRTRETDVGDLDQTLRPRTRYVELNRRIDAQGVLYHSPALDFTDAIIKRLNDKYQRAKADKERLHPIKPPAPVPEEKAPEKGKAKEPPK
ncbi:MAG TPA: OmpH family outer membrane protein [Planctomycetota bacterium]|nr:OmpH family outer membrane protein [Planctomycetota bacterium]